MISNHALGRIQRFFGRSRAATYLAVKIRNQCNAVIRYNICDNNDAASNGEAWLAGQVAPRASTFIDVGANVGEWTAMFMQAMRNPGNGLLIEPSAPAVGVLQERFHTNANVHIIHAAASSEPGEMEFFEEPQAGKTSSLVRSFAAGHAVRRQVNVTTIDRETDAHHIEHVDMLKVDAEGFDFHVLQGARRLLSQQRVDVVQFEYNRPWAEAGSTLGRAVAFLQEYSYRVYLLKPTHLTPIDYGRIGEFFEYANFVALSPEATARLPELVN